MPSQYRSWNLPVGSGYHCAVGIAGRGAAAEPTSCSAAFSAWAGGSVGRSFQGQRTSQAEARCRGLRPGAGGFPPWILSGVSGPVVSLTAPRFGVHYSQRRDYAPLWPAFVSVTLRMRNWPKPHETFVNPITHGPSRTTLNG